MPDSFSFRIADAKPEDTVSWPMSLARAPTNPFSNVTMSLSMQQRLWMIGYWLGTSPSRCLKTSCGISQRTGAEELNPLVQEALFQHGCPEEPERHSDKFASQNRHRSNGVCAQRATSLLGWKSKTCRYPDTPALFDRSFPQ